MIVAFRCDAGPPVGMGHLMRCLTLADELARRGATCRFIVAGPVADAAMRGHGLSRLAAGPGVLTGDRGTAATIAALPSPCDWLIIDHYGLDRRDEQALRPHARRLLALDDLADRPHDVDLLIDPTIGRAAHDYAGLVPARTVTLTGGDYALLRPEFAALRRNASRAEGAVRRLHVAFGGGPWPPEAWRLLAAIAERFPALALVANMATDAGRPARMPGTVTLRVASQTIAADMAACDAALGAPGSMTWERLCLGLPFLCLTTHATQVEPVGLLAGQGLLIDAGPLRAADPDLIATVARFLDDHAARAALAGRAAAAIDGAGAGRIADAMARAA
jgi:UDP-2,4-diacetamido-2,4,6-trideoxy-beta-L-altropyranose hydrolase